MARYRLESAHTWPGDIYLEEGTEVGDDTSYPLYDGFVPSSAMFPLDDDARDTIKKMKEDRPHWSNRPEDNLPIYGDVHPIHRSPREDNQPIIPPPMEHLTRPNTLRPGEPSRISPLIQKSLEEQEAERAKLDEEEARKANAHANSIAKADGDGAPTKPAQAPVASGNKPAPPTPASRQVPRNTAGVVPQSEDGQPKDLSKENEQKDKK